MNAPRQLAAMIGFLASLLSACDGPLSPGSAPSPPPIPPSSSRCPNEPAGWALLSHRPFLPLTPSRAVPGGTELDPGWSSTGQFSLVRDVTAPDGDGWVGQETYTTANRIGSGTMSSTLLAPMAGRGYTGLYTCFFIKVDPNYIGEGSGVNKQFWFQVGTTSGNKIIALMHIPGHPLASTLPMWLALRYQGLDNVPSSPAIFNPALSAERGTWHRFEMQAELESSKGAADGWIATYTDGQLATRTSGLRFTLAAEPREFAGAKWNNTYGGSVAFCSTVDPVTKARPTQAAHPECFVPHTQYVWLDAQRVLAH